MAYELQNRRVRYIRLSEAAHYHKLEEGSWHINHVNHKQTNLVGDESGQYISGEKFKDMVWGNVRQCAKCYNCKPGNVMIVLGKQLDKVCHSRLMVKNPDIDSLSCAKKVV